MVESRIATQRSEPAIAAISDRFGEFCSGLELTAFTCAADKHSSLVWEAGKTTQGLNRYLTFSLTPQSRVLSGVIGRRRARSAGFPHQPPAANEISSGRQGEPAISWWASDPLSNLFSSQAGDPPSDIVPYHASVTILVDNEKQCTSQVHESWYYESEDSIFRDVNSGRLDKAWESAWNWALQLTERNLTEFYVHWTSRR